MKLSQLNKNSEAIITKISANDDLKQRFYSFGIVKGASIYVENISLAKNTIEINVDDTDIGLRVVEADTIEVEIV
ncbi:MAG: FeoA domain-containing protein [Campylobacterota bacterium]|nr:FeoA domain-containing protein [Campylobacterota bacterium]